MKNQKTSSEIDSYILKNYNKSDKELAEALGMKVDAVSKRKERLRGKHANLVKKAEVSHHIRHDIDKTKQTIEYSNLEVKYDAAIERLAAVEKELEVALNYKKPTPQQLQILPHVDNDNEATAIVLASDWHIEEQIDGEMIGYLNEYSLDIAKSRSEKFFRSTVALLKKEQAGIQIDNLVLALLGDFISGYIHDSLMEANQLAPADAIVFVEELMIPGIDYILNNTNVKIKVLGVPSNHGRLTKKVHFNNQRGNNIETVLYTHLKRYYEKNERVEVLISKGYSMMLEIYGYRVRFHHGHSIKYSGGVGGITIPVRKAIAQWNKANPAHLDCFGHMHTYTILNNAVVNGSMCGYGTFSEYIKADFEKPTQAFFLIDKKRGQRAHEPITFE